MASTSTSTLDLYSSTTRVQVQVPSTTSVCTNFDCRCHTAVRLRLKCSDIASTGHTAMKSSSLQRLHVAYSNEQSSRLRSNWGQC